MMGTGTVVVRTKQGWVMLGKVSKEIAVILFFYMLTWPLGGPRNRHSVPP
jgi:hypothetical protein